MLTIHVSSRGSTMGQLELPMPLEEIRRQLETIRTKCQPDDVLSICSAACPIPDISWHLQHTQLDSDTTLQKLNQLAEAIGNMNAVGHYHLYKSLSTDSRQSLDGLLRNAVRVKPVSMDCYEVIPEVTTHQALGKWLVEHDHLEEQAPESLRAGADDEVIDTIEGYMDFTRLGEDSLAEDGVRRTEYGLVRRLSEPFPPEQEIGQAML